MPPAIRPILIEHRVHGECQLISERIPIGNGDDLAIQVVVVNLDVAVLDGHQLRFTEFESAGLSCSRTQLCWVLPSLLLQVVGRILAG